MTKQKKGRRKNTTIWWVVGLVVVAAGLMGVARVVKGKDAVKVEVEEAKIRTIYSSTSESGSIQPTIDVPMAPDVSGEVVNLYIQEGMQVKKGDLLVTIRPDNYRAAVEQAQAGVNQARSNELQAKAAIEQARANKYQDSVNLARTEDLFNQEVVSRQEFENAQLRFNVSKSQLLAASYSAKAAYYQVKTSEASLKQARQNLDRTNIYASMDGTITKLNVELGQRVVGTMQMAGTEILKIADLSSMEVVVEISENDIVNLNLGDSAKIEVDAFPDREFYGRVSEIAYSAKMDMQGSTDQVTNFEVKVIISPESYRQETSTVAAGDIPKLATSPFRPGMTALVEIFTDAKAEVVSVPIQSVTLSKKDKDEDEVVDRKKKKDEKKQEVVFKVVDGMAVEIPVETGISDDNYIYIKEGIKEGESIVTGSYSTLTKVLEDSMKVEIDTGDDGETKWGTK